MLLGIAVFVVLAVFVWPTRYKYDHMKLGEDDLPVRIDRLTGKTEILFPQGWHAASEKTAENQIPAEQELPAEEVAKPTGQAQITSYGWVEIEVYNGSNWKLSEITMLVTVLDSRKAQILSRPYRLLPEAYGNPTPESNTKFHASLGLELYKVKLGHSALPVQRESGSNTVQLVTLLILKTQYQTSS
jgi:hypothetical protein